MKRFIEPARRLLGGAAFWGVVLLVLPNCNFDASYAQPEYLRDNLEKGPRPRSSAIYCDIEKERHCATAQELNDGIPLTAAAVALTTGDSSGIGLDYSLEATARCGGGPEAVLFEGPFPDGLPVCLNCGEVIGIGKTYHDVDDACVAHCYDLNGAVADEGTVIPYKPPTAESKEICDRRTSPMGRLIQPAKASTNIDRCFEDACPDAGGAVNPGFRDPRRTPDPVQWEYQVGTTAGPGGDLTRVAPTTGAHDAGAVSRQWFSRGDGYVEFGANNNTQQHVLGVSQLPAGCPPLSCADTSQDFTTIGYAFVLDAEGQITISLGGRNVGAFGTYGPTDRFRVSLAETLTGTARITFGRVTAFCTSGGVCSVDPLYTAEVRATYPLRVDTSFLDENSRLTDVRVVYIK